MVAHSSGMFIEGSRARVWAFFWCNLMNYDKKYLKNIVSDGRQNFLTDENFFFEKNRHFLKISYF